MEQELSHLATAGNIKSVIAGRISYLLNLRGPSLLVDTACSSSLVALHTACKAIRNGDCEMAIVGGVKITLAPIADLQDSIGILSSDGRSRSFSDDCEGIGLGEGSIALIVKSYDRAVEDKDPIYAIIKGSSVNQDGASAGLTAPNPLAQEELHLRVWRDAGIKPESLSYIEAHGTATKLGDPIEIDGIKRAFDHYTEKQQFCAIGSVKSNLGHLDSLSGLAGVVKAVMSLQKKKIPPSIHFKRPNRKIPFHKSPVYINDILMDWEEGALPRRCGVSSFGISGTNCHVILEEYVEHQEVNQTDQHCQLFVLSAKTENSLTALINEYANALHRDRRLRLLDICYTASTGRDHHPCRLSIVCDSLDDLLHKLNHVHKHGLDAAADQSIHWGFYTVAPAEKPELDPWEMTLPKKQKIDMELASEVQLFLQGEGDLNRIGLLYSLGADTNWNMLYEGDVQRVHLPSYVFEMDRCWVRYPDEPGFMYRTSWSVNESEDPRAPFEASIVLIFKDRSGYAGELASGLRNYGCERVVEVEYGHGFQRAGDNRYIIGYSENDIFRLLDEIQPASSLRIVHMATIGNSIAGERDEQPELGVYSLFHISKAIEALSHINKAELYLITQNANEITSFKENMNPGNAAFLGLGKAVNLENHRLQVSAIDFDQHVFINKIIDEMGARHTALDVAYREGKRYTGSLESVSINMVDDHHPVVYKENGVYVITGGTGSLGLLFAKHLASQAKVNLALINRSELPPKDAWTALVRDEAQSKALRNKIEDLLQIESTGASVTVYAGDVTIESDMSAILNDLRRKFGTINGIIHGAGVAGRELVLLKDESRDSLERVMEPKVKGAVILDRLTEKDQLDFFVLFSSVVALTGGIGVGGYTAANAYLDGFASWRSRRGKRTLSINWPTWRHSVEHTLTTFDESKHLFKLLKVDDALRGFQAAVSKSVSRLIIGELNYSGNLMYLERFLPIEFSPEIKRKLARLEKRQTKHRTPAVDKQAAQSGGGNKCSTTEQRLSEIWSRVLGVEEISIYDHFDDLGGDSIMVAQLFKELELEYPGRLEIVDVFSYSSISSMAQFLDRNSGQAEQEEKMKRWTWMSCLGKLPKVKYRRSNLASI